MKSALKSTTPKKPKSQESLIANLKKAVTALGWDIFIPVNDAGQVVPYAIVGRPLFTTLVKDQLDKTGFNKILSRTFVEDIKESK